MTVTPLVVEEDSRCPSDVSCIWAGRLVLRASVEKGDKSEEKLLELGVPARTKGGMLTLTDAGPAPVSTGPAPEYRFTFSYAPDLAR
ncbi:MAG: hypothetical protein IE933_00200 [Sphingomonadales bacterium]|nr:hypothetical protein [Sphingomonadales bacterium]MBD3772746.1 hypothetical protein [Paracoccaceae bacterium]